MSTPKTANARTAGMPPVVDMATWQAARDELMIREKAHVAHGLNYGPILGVGMLIVGLVFVWRSFYAMRIPKKDAAPAGAGAH